MNILTINSVGFSSNTYILSSGADAAVVDPSAPTGRILSLLSENGLRLRYILLTHGHFDHFLSIDALRRDTHAKSYIHIDDAEALSDSNLNASAVFGMEFFALDADYTILDGDCIALGRENIEVISTPGHTPGSVCYYADDMLICGDTLFSSSYGRYDLPGGDGKTLFSSLRSLAQRRDDPMIYPGHGSACKLSSASVIQEIRYSGY